MLNGANAAGRQRQRRDRAEVVFGTADREQQASTRHAAGRAAMLPVRDQPFVIRIQRKPGERLAGSRRSCRKQRVVGIDDQPPVCVERARDGELDVGERFEIVHAVFAEMIRADAGDDRGVGASTASPRRSMPPRAVSRTAASTRASRSTVRAPAGPE